MNKQLLTDYAAIKSSIKELEEQAKELSKAILSELDEAGADKVETDLGAFIVIPRKTWKFSPAVTQAEEALDGLKLQEQQTGVATFTESKSLRFDQKKDK